MHDARDAEDKRLLEAGEYKRLLENYVYLVRQWTLVRLRDREAADEVSQRVFLRLLRELRAGSSRRAARGQAVRGSLSRGRMEGGRLQSTPEALHPTTASSWM